MRCKGSRFAAIGGLLVFALALSIGRQASGALEEKTVLDSINSNVAVLRHLHIEVAKLQQNLAMVRAARALTQLQLDSIKKLYAAEAAKGEKDRSTMMKTDLDRLQRQMTKLNEFDFEKLYGDRIDAYKKQIEQMAPNVDARVAEYETLFGKKPQVDLNFEEVIKRYGAERAHQAYFLNLD